MKWIIGYPIALFTCGYRYSSDKCRPTWAHFDVRWRGDGKRKSDRNNNNNNNNKTTRGKVKWTTDPRNDRKFLFFFIQASQTVFLLIFYVWIQRLFCLIIEPDGNVIETDRIRPIIGDRAKTFFTQKLRKRKGGRRRRRKRWERWGGGGEGAEQEL